MKIINDSAKVLKVFLRCDLKVDAGDTDKDGRESRPSSFSFSLFGTGNVTLELDGKNELKGGTVIAQGGTGETGGSGVQSATISGGTVVAVGGAGSKTGGDGFNEYGTVKVTGGSVTAQGGKGNRERWCCRWE